MAEQTQTATPASGAAASSDAANLNTGSDPVKPVNPAKVEGKETEDKGNSAASDEQDGADATERERARPGRAERRISELTSKIKELEGELDKKDDLTTRLQGTSIDTSQVNLPDYSQMTEITPDQIKKDIVTAATQIVDLRMQTTANVLESKISRKDASDKSAQAIEAAVSKYPVLNPESEDYDEALDREISDSYVEILQKDPSYSFARFIKPMERFLAESSTTSKDAASTGPRSRGSQANRGSAASRSSNAFDPNWSAERMEKWFAERR